MKLITKKVEKLMDKYPLYSQDGKGKNAVCIVKFFHTLSNWTWYVLEGDKKSGEFFGIVSGFEIEYGYFTLDELAKHTKWGVGVERDRYFDPQPIKDIDDPRLREFVERVWNKKNQ
ncbi:MAG: DUF2958 domain-containing protein [Bacteroidales bacterium]|nr:DUF2958 domain-containing protein [Bacteroidales bacterium]